MGVYSWVEHKCDCGGYVEFQTGLGPKEYGTYPINAVPLEVADDIKDKVRCCPGCGKAYKIDVKPKDVQTVEMEVTSL